MDIAMPTNSVKSSAVHRWLIGAILFAAAAAAPAPSYAQVVVVANGSPITAYDIEQRTKLIETSTHKKPTREEVIQDLIDDRLKIAKAKSYNFEVPDAEVNKAFVNMATQQHVSVKQFVELLARAGIAPETIKARIRAELTWNGLVRGKFSSSLQVDESDIAQAMRANNDQAPVGYIYTLYPVTVVVPSGSTEATVAAKKREAESLRARFTNCKDGLAVARALRDVAVREPVSRSSADLPPQLRDLLNKMEVGRLTSPDTTAQGLQMFALCGKKASKAESPVERELRNKIFAERFKQEAKKYLEDIRKSAMIEYK
jgi:peptidyl-prolyl cis-trans isomerase SurA